MIPIWVIFRKDARPGQGPGAAFFSMQARQKTIAGPVSCRGIGLHSGKEVGLTVLPAPVHHGIRFSRADLPGRPTINALFRNVVDTSLATVIGNHGAIVSTIEHLMAAFAGMGVDNALVETDSYELPIMDGSAAPFTDLLAQVGTRDQETPRTYFRIHAPIRLEQGDRWVEITPDDRFTITCTIFFSHPAIREQSFCLPVEGDVFAREIAPARTFGFLHRWITCAPSAWPREGRWTTPWWWTTRRC